jgi:hypothetical protein
MQIFLDSLTRLYNRPNHLFLSADKNLAEGVGFEPTVGCPTLDFESSALNRTQPPFPNETPNFQRSASNVQCKLRPENWANRWLPSGFQAVLAASDSGTKKCYN